MQRLQQNCPAAYDEYHSGESLRAAGWTLLGIGAGMALGANISVLIQGINVSNLSFDIVALGCDIACIPILCVGYAKINKSVEVFNLSCSSQETAKNYWSINASDNGIGLAYHF